MSIDKKRFLEKQSLSSDVALYIKNSILEGDLFPGDRIVETKLARELGISQTPIREAIRQMAGEGIVNIVTNKGPHVRTFSSEDVFEIYSVRSVLEGLAIRMAVQNATSKDIEQLENFYKKMKEKLRDDTIKSLSQDSAYIHQFIYRLSKHTRLMMMYDTISFQVLLVNKILGRKFTKEIEVSEHWELVEALKKGDPENAEKVMREHIKRSYREFVDFGKFNASEPIKNYWF